LAPSSSDQGQADRYAQWFFNEFDPMIHIEAYERDLDISFQCGGADQHVPAASALRFREVLAARNPLAVDRIQVAVYEGLSHLDAARDDRLSAAAVDWLAPDQPDIGDPAPASAREHRRAFEANEPVARHFGQQDAPWIESPPYPAIQTATGGSRRQRLALVQAICGFWRPEPLPPVPPPLFHNGSIPLGGKHAV